MPRSLLGEYLSWVYEYIVNQNHKIEIKEIKDNAINVTIKENRIEVDLFNNFVEVK